MLDKLSKLPNGAKNLITLVIAILLILLVATMLNFTNQLVKDNFAFVQEIFPFISFSL